MTNTMEKVSWAEPYKIKMVEPLFMTTREQREKAMEEAGYNTFLLKSEDVYIDLLTDSGTSAMSDRQWAGMMLGDEAYAGSRNFYNLEAAIQKYYGYKHVIPTHQGRGAENLISRILIKPGDIIPGNMYFTTTKLHQEMAGGTFVDIIVDEAHDANSTFPFKGNVDLKKLEAVIDRARRGEDPLRLHRHHGEHGRWAAAVVGEPEGRARAHREAWHPHHPRYDACGRERVHDQAAWKKAKSERSTAEIVKELCSLTDGATMSAKKDALVNIGGFSH